jgi:translation initiation factor IF-2
MALVQRPPVITIMGHVDHGKTTLLDYIRKTKVTAGEAGGITQHIGAYQIEYKGKLLTFIDTPGHAAFNKMRERGAQITDIVILVVAADDGVMPQTIESIRHIKKANVEVVVAINKIDKPNASVEMAKSQLVEHGIAVQGYGGDIDAIEISAVSGKNVDSLLDTLLTMADLQELTADPAAPLEAVVIESSMDRSRGSVASVIVRQGSLSIRQEVYTDTASGRIKSLVNERSEQLKVVTPGSPAEIIGFTSVPGVGAVVRDLAAEYPVEEVEEAEAVDAPVDLGIDFGALLEQQPKLKMIIKADVEGTLEAIIQNLDDESVDLLDAAVGEVTERDLELAEASGAVIISFHIKVPNRIKKLAKGAEVKIKYYDIIYQLIEDLQKQMLRLMEPTIDEQVLGEAEILQIFEMKGERIAGSKVTTGEFKRNDLLHLKRDGEIVANPVIKSMMHGKEEVAQAKTKSEFGMTFRNRKLDFRVGDILVAYKKVLEE